MNTTTQHKQDTATLQIDTAALINTIKAADLARGKDKGLLFLTAYRLELADNKLQFITTDRYRLSVISIQLDELQAADLAASGIFNTGGLTIDGDTLTSVAKIKTKQNTLHLTITSSGLTITHDTGTITAPVSDSEYPKWREIVTKLDTHDTSTTGNYNPQYLADAAKACHIIGGKNTPLNITLRGNYPATLNTQDGQHLTISVLLMPVRVAN